ncbi:MAG: TolC family protein [Bacillota bacterium]
MPDLAALQNLRLALPPVKPLHWCAALAFSLLLSFFLGAFPGAAEDGPARELTVEEAKELAYNHNVELRLSRVALEQAELSLEILDQSIDEMENRRRELLETKDELEERREQIQAEIDELEELEDPPEDELAALYRELGQVEMAILVVDQAIEAVDQSILELENRYNQAEQALLEGESLIRLQEEMLAFMVESLFAGNLIVLERQPLQQKALQQANQAWSAELEKEKAGYSTPLLVEEAAAKRRGLEALGGELELKLIDLLDQLCLACGLTPGTALTLIPFTPIAPQAADLDEALAEALNSGWLVQQRRERLADLQEERDRVKEQYGEDSLRYEAADLAVEQAELQLRQEEGETAAAVRRTYFAMLEKERAIIRAEADLALGRRQKQALEAQLETGYGTPVEAALAPLALAEKEAALLEARYLYHLAYREFDLARRGFYASSDTGKGY